eukprot:TRINITY_DN21738_c2_g1_i1.p1 TRINITY_DN21738_c2_g1~~TRINITY_DN21738_c2_g1_i1.p1  ORF type:complete len:683 (+),score=150.73 TRINITY_DN21738_c2_g1_i1:233-2050(+)
MRKQLETERTYHFRKLRCSSVEQEARGVIERKEVENFQLLASDEEESVRDIIDTERLFGLRALYRIRLEAWQRALVNQDRLRCVLTILSEVEEAERELVAADYGRQMLFIKLLKTEHIERADNILMASRKYVRLCELQEGVHRQSVQQHLLQSQQSIVSTSQGSAFVVLVKSEEIEREHTISDERKWRNRCVVAEESLRLHIEVLPIQRQWRIKLGWIHFKETVRSIIQEAQNRSRELIAEHTESMFEYSELSHRDIIGTYEEKEFNSLKYDQSNSLLTLKARDNERSERLAFEDSETEIRISANRNEALSRIELVYKFEEDIRNSISQEGWMTFTSIISSSEEETRSQLEPDFESSLRSIFTVHAFEQSIINITSEEGTLRDELLTSEADEFKTVTEMINWIQSAPTEVADREEKARNEITEVEFKARGCFIEIHEGRLEQMERRKQAAVKIQLSWKRYMAICMTEALHTIRVNELIVAETEHRGKCAVDIQARWKGYIVRQCGGLELLAHGREERIRARERDELRENACIIIQRAFCRNSRRNVGVKRAIIERNALLKERESFFEMKEFVEELNYHARLVQSAWRMYRVRKWLVEQTFRGEWA